MAVLDGAGCAGSAFVRIAHRTPWPLRCPGPLGAGVPGAGGGLRQVLAHDAGQLEHGDLRLAKHRQQQRIGVDGALVAGVLQALGLDVVPHLFDDLGVRHRLGANHGSQGGAGLFAGAGGLGFFGSGLGGSFGRGFGRRFQAFCGCSARGSGATSS